MSGVNFDSTKTSLQDLLRAIDAGKMKGELGWEPRYEFSQALPLTVEWYQSQALWLQQVRSGAYRDYYDQQYAGRESAT